MSSKTKFGCIIKWLHFSLALIFYLKYCFSYLENHVLPSSLDLCGVQTLKYPN